MTRGFLAWPLMALLLGAEPGGPPTPVLPDRQGLLVLTAPAARLHGQGLALDAPRGVIRGWHGDTCRAAWEVAVPRETSYQVVVEYALAGPGPGGPIRLRAGDASREAFAAPTGSRSRFLPQPLVDPIALPPGRTTLTLDAPGLPAGSALEVRAVRLVPANP
jgi:hypothetical protein